MERFGSFNADHQKLDAGIYISRIDSVGSGAIYTIDIRSRKPYKDKGLDKVLAHSMEHIIATNLEKLCKGEIKKIYFGIMGCLTGYYSLFYVPEVLCPAADRLILNYLHLAFDEFVSEVPFDDPKLCGNNKILAHTVEEMMDVNKEMSRIDDMILRCMEKNSFDVYPMVE